MPDHQTKLGGKFIRCILFDLGHTLWTHIESRASLEHLEEQATQRALALLTTHIPTQRPGITGQQLRRAIYDELYKQKQLNPLYEPDPATATVKALSDQGLAPLEPAAGALIFEAMRVRSIHSRQLFPDVLTTLEALRQRGFILGVVTNRVYGGLPFYEDLREFGLLTYFDYPPMAISADLRTPKPNPEIFLHALNALKVSPQETAMVGDSLYADVNGAHQLGMLSIWKPKLSLRASANNGHNPSSLLDETALFTYVQEIEKRREYSQTVYVQPDLTIEHISDLLPIFTKAGLQ